MYFLFICVLLVVGTAGGKYYLQLDVIYVRYAVDLMNAITVSDTVNHIPEQYPVLLKLHLAGRKNWTFSKKNRFIDFW